MKKQPFQAESADLKIFLSRVKRILYTPGDSDALAEHLIELIGIRINARPW